MRSISHSEALVLFARGISKTTKPLLAEKGESFHIKQPIPKDVNDFNRNNVVASIVRKTIFFS